MAAGNKAKMALPPSCGEQCGWMERLFDKYGWSLLFVFGVKLHPVASESLSTLSPRNFLLHLCRFWPQQAAVFREKAPKTHNTPPTLHKQQTDTVRDQLVNIVEHLAAKEPDIYLRSW